MYQNFPRTRGPVVSICSQDDRTSLPNCPLDVLSPRRQYLQTNGTKNEGCHHRFKIKFLLGLQKIDSLYLTSAWRINRFFLIETRMVENNRKSDRIYQFKIVWAFSCAPYVISWAIFCHFGILSFF